MLYTKHIPIHYNCNFWPTIDIHCFKVDCSFCFGYISKASLLSPTVQPYVGILVESKCSKNTRYYKLVRYKCSIICVLYLPKYINAVLVTKLNKSSTLIHDFSIAAFRSYRELYLKYSS